MNLVSGCSYTYGASWPQLLLGQHKNLGSVVAGNGYIADSIYLETNQETPEKIFVLWSGINRLDLTLPSHVKSQEVYTTNVHGTQYIHLPNKPFPTDNYNKMKGPNWPDITSFMEWNELPAVKKNETLTRGLFNTGHSVEQLALETFAIDANYHWQTQTLLSLLKIQCYAENYKIDYRFSFIADVFDEKNRKQFGHLRKDHPLYEQIYWHNYIDLTPFEYAVKHNGLMPDNFHVELDCMQDWATEVKHLW
jgi:hypothetical protein